MKSSTSSSRQVVSLPSDTHSNKRLQWADVVNRRASRALLADVLHALSLCAERGKHERQLHDEFERRELEHVSTEETRIKLEEQLWLAYAQIKDLSSSLQMEKLARQELAADVQDVFDRMREPVFGNSPSCLTTVWVITWDLPLAFRKPLFNVPVYPLWK